MSLAPLAALIIAAPLAWLLMPLGIRLAWAVGWLDQAARWCSPPP
jgi:hypothetical protein